MLMFVSYFTKAQNDYKDLPKYFIVDNDTIGIILSVDQAQKIDNDLEILNLFETLSLECDSLDTYYVKIINGLDEIILVHEVKIKNLMDKNKIQGEEILKLKTMIAYRETQLEISNYQKTNDSIRIKILEEDISKLKKKNVVTFISGVTIAVVFVLSLFLN